MKCSKKIFIVGYIFAIIAFLVLMFFSTDIVASISNHQNKMSLVEVNPDDYQAKNEIVYILGDCVISEGINPLMTCDGWAFCETLNDNPNKKISLIFVSEDETYKVDLDVLERADVRIANINSKNILGDNHGFYGKFSLLNMENGIYKLYIYCWENEENYGMEYTGKEYIKNNREFREWIWTSSVVDKDFSKAVQKDITNYVDSVHLQEDGSISITGWAYAAETNCEQQKVYLNILDSKGNVETYDTKQVERKDVGEAFKSSNYNKSGFSALIPSGELEKGEITIRIYIENEDVIYKASTDDIYTID